MNPRQVPPGEEVIKGHYYDSAKDRVYNEEGEPRGPVFRKGELLDLKDVAILRVDGIKPKKLTLGRSSEHPCDWPPLRKGDRVICKGFHFKVQEVKLQGIILKPYVGPIVGEWKELK